MRIVLSQKKDSQSEYDDHLYKTYHFPKKYINNIHTGDQFIYCQDDRKDASRRCYFGSGKVGKISILEDETYKAELLECTIFQNEVPIYSKENNLDMKYIESIDYQSVRKKQRPPWQWSIRPISKGAFDYIMNHSKLQTPEVGSFTPVAHIDANKRIKEEKLMISDRDRIKLHENKLKEAIRSYFLENNYSALGEISDEANILSGLLNFSTDEN